MRIEKRMGGDVDEAFQIREDVPTDASESALDVRSAGLSVDGRQIVLHGRTLHIVLWIASHQTDINTLRSINGQLWLSWKGMNKPSIIGKVLVQI